MRIFDLSNIISKKLSNGRIVYDWNASIGRIILLTYNYINDEMILYGLCENKNYIKVKYNNKLFEIKTTQVKSGKFTDDLIGEICSKHNTLMHSNRYYYFGEKSLGNWLKANNSKMLELWDYKKNNLSPFEISQGTTAKFYIKCENGLHSSTLVDVYHNKKSQRCYCVLCNSIKHNIIQKYGEDYFNNIWSAQNTKESELYSFGSANKVFIKCQNNPDHPDYDVQCNYLFKNRCGCPYCSGKRLHISDSLGMLYPSVIDVWSDKNFSTPYNYSRMSNQEVWFKCENSIHDDYLRVIDRSVICGFRCPTCSVEYKRSNTPKGKDSVLWKGGKQREIEILRGRREYKHWRSSVFQKDEFTCQCCLDKGCRLNAHHIYSFAKHKDKRFDIDNGITLCESCHATTSEGSFHNLYGTNDVSPIVLEEFINNKRKQLGIEEKFSLDKYICQNQIGG